MMMAEVHSVVRAFDRLRLLQPIFGSVEFEVMPRMDAVMLCVTAHRVNNTRPGVAGSGAPIIDVRHEVVLADLPPSVGLDDFCYFELRRAISEVLLHEMDECLVRDGERVRDPHIRETIRADLAF